VTCTYTHVHVPTFKYCMCADGGGCVWSACMSERVGSATGWIDLLKVEGLVGREFQV